LARAALTGGQYLLWKVAYQEHCQDTAQRNQVAGNAAWNMDMLMGSGQYAGNNNQINFPPAVYLQIATAAMRSWKTIQGTGDLQGQLSKVIQGSNEPYADFVDRLIQTASRIFGDVDAAMPLIKQLAYEQANKWCKEAIRPWKNRDLASYLKACKDINDSVIQANVMATTFANLVRPSQPRGLCYNCHKPGHLQRDCPDKGNTKFRQVCPRCRKGPHKAVDCRSTRDIDGNPLHSKNGKQGPWSRGPQIYGAFQQVPRPMYPLTDQSEPPKEAQDWTSVPPPEQY
ncbi:endogenous retrovirus group K member 5 Gag polyprotein-like protein, partial [Leptotrombidium deliense]